NGAAIVWLEQQTGGGWLLLTSQGMANYRDGIFTKLTSEVSKFIRKNSLTCAIRLPNGKLAIGTLNAGLILTDAASTQIEGRWDIDSGLPTNEIYSLANDR